MSGDIRLNMLFFGCVVPYVHKINELCNLWSYWTKFYKIFTRYRGIICAVNAHIEVVISNFVFECQSDEI